ncbi:MAG: extracellular solute-binding protein [Candidatus Zixiibacteriota bacterium]|nr:MAG: extracellular solute-binding protein [candidate division Zixibacteria bacterium]
MRWIYTTLSLFILSCSGNKHDSETIRFWQFWSDMNTKPVVEKIINDFEKENPGVKVKITDLTWANGHDKLVISFAAKDPPDVMELGSDWIAEFASEGLLTEFQSEFPENYLSPAIWQGEIYALPWMLASRIFYFNLDLLEKAGVGIPQNWKDLHTACERIDGLGDDYFGFGCNSAEKHRLYKKYLPFLWSNGGRIFSPDGKSCEMDSDKAIEALEFYLSLCDCGAIESQRRLEEYFIDGKLGFVISGGWLLNRLLRSDPGFEYKLVQIMKPDGGAGISFFGGEYIAVNAESKNLEISKKLAEFLVRKENSQALCDAAGFGFPPYTDLEIEDPVKQVLAFQLENSRSSPPTPLWVYIEQDIEDAIEAAMYEHGSARDILIKAATAIDNKLKSEEYADQK